MIASGENMFVALSLLVAAVLATAVSGDFKFDFDCQFDPRWLRTVHSIDVGPLNSPFVEHTLVRGGAIDIADGWLRNYFRFSVNSGLTSFSNKQAVTGRERSFCYKEIRELKNESMVTALSNMQLYVDDYTDSTGVEDGLYYTAVSLDWTKPLNSGRRAIFLYAGGPPAADVPTPGLSPFTGTKTCEEESVPSTQNVIDALNDTSADAIFVVPEDLVDVYKARYQTELVVPQIEDPVLMAEFLLRGLDAMFCLVPIPPKPELITTTTTSTATTTGTATVLATAVSEFKFDFDCQVDPRWLRTVHSIDVGPLNSPFVYETLIKGGAIDIADGWLRNYFRFSASSGLTSFTNKQSVSGEIYSFCYKEIRELKNESMVTALSNMELYVDDYTDSTGVEDGLYYTAVSLDWTKPLNAGRRAIFLYAGGPPAADVPTPGLSPFTGTKTCEEESVPSTQNVIDALNDTSARAIFVVPEDLVDLYKARYQTELVVPQIEDPVLMAEFLLRGLDAMFCLVPIPPKPELITTTTTSTATTTGTTTGTTTATSTTTPPSTSSSTYEYDGYLEVVSAVDISYSHGDDLAMFLGAIVGLVQMLSDVNNMELRGMGLVSFSDKPFAPFGYPGDYCYREDAALTLDPDVLTRAVDGLRILSGRDWKESQYSVLRSTILSNTLGWSPGNTFNGRPVLRIVILATDSLSHDSSSSAELPPVGDDCNTTNYADPLDVGAAFTGRGYPIIVATPDVFSAWETKVKDFNYPAVVLNLHDVSTRGGEVLTDAVQDLYQLMLRDQQTAAGN